ncbi:MAG: ATP-binding cassette domain-containing protein [Bacteroidota bacterium]
MSILKLEQVTKTYGDYTAVDKVSFAVNQGGIFGLLGPNGAGKTSLIRMITTITNADQGKIYFNGNLLNADHPKQIGYMPEERGLYRRMKVGEHLMYLARLKGLSKNDAKANIREWMEKFDIKDWWYKKVNELSKGMQQKIQFITTVIHKPNLLILDEPFSGLDPLNTNLIKSEIRNLKEAGTTIIFSTHRMEQVEMICEYIVLINEGKNVLEGRVDDIKDNHKENLFRLEFKGELPQVLAQNFSIVEAGDQYIVVKALPGASSNDLLQSFLSKNVQVSSFQEILPSLNEIFIRQIEGGLNV